VTQTKTIFISFITPPTGRVVLTVRARVVPLAQVGDHGGVVLLGALLEMSGPVHALPVREGGEVRVPVDTHLLIMAPHAEPAGAVRAAVPGRAGDRAVT